MDKSYYGMLPALEFWVIIKEANNTTTQLEIIVQVVQIHAQLYGVQDIDSPVL
jgi:hypothetical protein